MGDWSATCLRTSVEVEEKRTEVRNVAGDPLLNFLTSSQ